MNQVERLRNLLGAALLTRRAINDTYDDRELRTQAGWVYVKIFLTTRAHFI